MSRRKGGFTLPGEAGYEELTLKLAEKWGGGCYPGQRRHRTVRRYYTCRLWDLFYGLCYS